MTKKVTYVVGDDLGTPVVVEHMLEEETVKRPLPKQSSTANSSKAKGKGTYSPQDTRKK